MFSSVYPVNAIEGLQIWAFHFSYDDFDTSYKELLYPRISNNLPSQTKSSEYSHFLQNLMKNEIELVVDVLYVQYICSYNSTY